MNRWLAIACNVVIAWKVQIFLGLGDGDTQLAITTIIAALAGIGGAIASGVGAAGAAVGGAAAGAAGAIGGAAGAVGGALGSAAGAVGGALGSAGSAIGGLGSSIGSLVGLGGGAGGGAAAGASSLTTIPVASGSLGGVAGAIPSGLVSAVGPSAATTVGGSFLPAASGAGLGTYASALSGVSKLLGGGQGGGSGGGGGGGGGTTVVNNQQTRPGISNFIPASAVPGPTGGGGAGVGAGSGYGDLLAGTSESLEGNSAADEGAGFFQRLILGGRANELGAADRQSATIDALLQGTGSALRYASVNRFGYAPSYVNTGPNAFQAGRAGVKDTLDLRDDQLDRRLKEASIQWKMGAQQRARDMVDYRDSLGDENRAEADAMARERAAEARAASLENARVLAGEREDRIRSRPAKPRAEGRPRLIDEIAEIEERLLTDPESVTAVERRKLEIYNRRAAGGGGLF
jgi:hypothetical protein